MSDNQMQQQADERRKSDRRVADDPDFPGPERREGDRRESN
ncbi:MAG: hypothetical protein ACT4OE_06530 [Sphingosinicella sp.]